LKQPIKCILSDLGKVVAEYDNELTVTRFTSWTAQPAVQVRSVLFNPHHGLHGAFEEGKFDPESFREAIRIACDLHPELDDETFDDIYANIFTPMTEVQTLWRRLRAKGITFTAVSNIDWIRWEPLVTMGLPNLFDHLILSCDEKLAKPSKELMVRALNKSGAKAETTLFIDDKPENLMPAAELGIRVHQYETYGGLLKFLEEQGLGAYLFAN